MDPETPSDFALDRQDDGEVVRLELSGELDLATVEPLEQAVAAALGAARGLEVDLRGLAFMDSSGIRALLQARDDATAAGVSFAVALPATGEVHLVLHESGVARLLLGEEPE